MHTLFWTSDLLKFERTHVSLRKVYGVPWGALLSQHNQDKLNGYVKNFNLKHGVNRGKSCVFCNNHPTGSFSRVCKKECSPHTLSNISFEQNIPMSKGLVTSEASVICFFFIYSFPVCASLLISAETSSAGEAINRWKPVF